MQGYRVCILIATLITISFNSCLALNCTVPCDEGVQKCFIKTDDTNQVTRGCLTTGMACDPPSCIACEGENCNSVLVCKHCDGSQAACAQSTVTDNIYNQMCAANQVCVNQVNENKTVTRGCNAACTNNDADCQSCDKDYCNVGIYPKDRRQCYQCSGENCNEITASMLMPCGLNQPENQSCYTIGTSDKDMQRGCTTDTNPKCPLNSADKSCAFCNNNDGCNNSTFMSTLGSCIKCNDKESCAQEQQADSALSAQCQFKYTQTVTSCYSQLANDGTVERGCDNEDKCATAINCKSCNGTNCNLAEMSFTCLYCRSDNYPECRDAAVGGQKCSNQNLTAEASGQCFSGEWNGVVIRGCLIDASPLMQYQCNNKDDKRCESCHGLDCNKKVINGAITLQHLGFGLMALIYIVTQSL